MSTLRPGATERIMARLFPKESPYLRDPNGWIRDILGEDPWSKQEEINDSVVDNRYTAGRSCHDVGKSWDVSRLVCWWLDVHPIGTAFAVTTAPTDSQVKAILWREIRRAHTKARARHREDPRVPELQGRITLDAQWYMGEDELVAYGRKPSDYAPAAFQGIHARYVLVVIDEACGVSLNLWNAVDTLITNENSRVVAIGNPDDPISNFELVCRPDSGWNVVGISAFDSPNFTDEEVSDEVAESLISRVWVDERRARWGESSPLYISKVLGQFPVDSEDAVVPASWMAKSRIAQDLQTTMPRELGVDVGAGGDESVIALRYGAQGSILHRDRNPDTMSTAGRVFGLAVKHKATKVKVDSIGIGKGVADRLKELVADAGLKIEVIAVNVGERSDDPKRFPRLRDQLWWELGRELSEDQGWDLSEITDDTAAQLCSPKYGIDSSGRIKVEPKDDTKKRLGSSPDQADALLLAFYTGRPIKRWRLV